MRQSVREISAPLDKSAELIRRTACLDSALERQLAAHAGRSGRSRSDVARDALRRQLVIMQFEDVRRSVMPEARGYPTDEAVFRTAS